MFHFVFQLLFFLEEKGIDFKDVLVEIVRLETCHGDVQIGLHDRRNVTLVHTEMERLNIVVVRQNSVDFGLDEHVRNDCGQVICSDLLVLVQRVRLLNDFHHFLELL